MDISEAKTFDVFAQGDGVILRPYREEHFKDRLDLRLEVNTALARWLLDKGGEEGYREMFREPSEFACMIFDAQTDEFVGEIMVNDYTKDVWELGWNVVSCKRRQGYLKRAGKLFIAALAPYVQSHPLKAKIDPDNAASIAAAKSLGAHIEGCSPSFFERANGPEWAERFKDEHPELLTPQLISYANELGVSPRDLMTKVLVLAFN